MRFREIQDQQKKKIKASPIKRGLCGILL